MQTPSAAACTHSPTAARISMPSFSPALNCWRIGPRMGQRNLSCAIVAPVEASCENAGPPAKPIRSDAARARLVTKRDDIARASVPQRLDDGVGHLLGVAEQHHRVVAEEELVLNAGVARAHAALDEEDRLRLVDVEDRHAVDGGLRV